jgi:hypothetical protein
MKLLQTPFFQVTLPLMCTFVATVWVAQWAQNKRFDDLNKRFDDLRADLAAFRAEVSARLTRIENKLDDHGTRIAVLEDRTSPLARGR